MTFQSFHFLIFFLAVLGLNRALLSHGQARKGMLLAANYYFYMCWDIRFCAVLAAITLANYVAAQRIVHATRERDRKIWVAFALAFSLGVLAYFKYANFLLESTFALAHSLNLPVDESLLRIVQPVGISFFTFQALSYTLDVYRRTEEPARSLLDYAVFVSFFPTLLSGPITRARDFLPQLAAIGNNNGRLIADDSQGSEGLMLILRGLAKKVLLADLIALHIVNPAFAAPSSYSSVFLVVALYGYTMQIYMDLSGYTDIARGVAKMLGFELPLNFRRPYLAPTVSNFWQRWHISMSSFFRDYLFFSVGGSKRGNVYRNLMVTFVAIGVWHGAGWNFIVYGFLHGGIVCLERMQRNRRAPDAPADPAWRIVFGIAYTFHFVVLTRLLFRADDLSAASHYAWALLTNAGVLAPWSALAIAALLASILLHFLPSTISHHGVHWLARIHPALQGALMVFVMFGLLAFSSGDAPFIYFQF